MFTPTTPQQFTATVRAIGYGLFGLFAGVTSLATGAGAALAVIFQFIA